MAVSQNSKILASDISGAIKSITRSGTTFTYTTVSGSTGTFTQQDNNTTYSAGTGLSLSSNKFSIANSGVTAGSYGPSANATPSYGATFNVPYVTVDATGRITAASTKTVKIPAAPSVGTPTSLTYYYANNLNYNGANLPSGGTWFLWRWGQTDSEGYGFSVTKTQQVAGGFHVTQGYAWFAIRVA